MLMTLTDQESFDDLYSRVGYYTMLRAIKSKVETQRKSAMKEKMLAAIDAAILAAVKPA